MAGNGTQRCRLPSPRARGGSRRRRRLLKREPMNESVSKNEDRHSVLLSQSPFETLKELLREEPLFRLLPQFAQHGSHQLLLVEHILAIGGGAGPVLLDARVFQRRLQELDQTRAFLGGKRHLYVGHAFLLP